MTSSNLPPYRILAVYKFVSPQLEKGFLTSLKQKMEALCVTLDVRGTLILSPEGLNGTVCYPSPKNDDDVLLLLLQTEFPGIRTRITLADRGIFPRLRIKVKPQIVTMGPPVYPTESVGQYVKPGKDWDYLLQDPDCLVVDTRNHYEVRIGTFRGAVNPNTHNFAEFPAWLEKEASSAKKIAMFCTGGIRCEKATSFAKTLFPEKPVYHLEGGILGYLDSVDEDKSHFNGECYVFDQRVAVTHGLRASEKYTPCFACRQPLSQQERHDSDYKEGLSCRYCINGSTEKQKRRFQDRNKQIDLATKRGKLHIHDPKFGATKPEPN